MKSDSIAYAIAGMCFGLILGWVIGTQQAGRAGGSARLEGTAPAQAAAPAQSQSGNQRTPPPLDEARVQQLTTILNSDPNNASAAVQLGNTYFDAERYPDA